MNEPYDPVTNRGGRPASDARPEGEAVNGPTRHEMYAHEGNAVVTCPVCISQIAGRQREGEAAMTDERQAGLRSVVASVQGDWPQHYSPDQAKAWIAACDRLEAALAVAQVPAPTCVYCSDEKQAGPCFGGDRCMALSAHGPRMMAQADAEGGFAEGVDFAVGEPRTRE